jgi:hypothetical protein
MSYRKWGLSLFLLAACHRERAPETYVPSDTTVLAGANLNKFRAWAPDTFSDASSLLVAFNGKDLLFIARGRQITLSGSPDAIRRATEHPNHSCDLCARAPHGDAWLVMRGGGPLPLSGNAANLNRLLRLTDWMTAAVTSGQKYAIDITAYCRSEDAARQFEETFRAAVTLAATAELADAVDVSRGGATVRINGSVSPDLIVRLLR